MGPPIQEPEGASGCDGRAKEETKSLPDTGNPSEVAEKTLNLLKKVFGEIDENEFIALYVTRRYSSPILTLIATILSQNTTEKNAFRAWFNLINRVEKPDDICKLSVREIEEAIRPAGLYKNKAKAIFEVCKRRLQIEEAVRRGDPGPLLAIKGIGRKTADVVLLNFGHKSFPVDTHIMRVAKRLGWASGSYEKVSKTLARIFEGKELEAHMYLILLGRRICKSRNPRCDECPLKDICKSFRQEAVGQQRP